MSNSVTAVPGAPELDEVLQEHYCHPNGTSCKKGMARWHSLWINITDKKTDSGRCTGRCVECGLVLVRLERNLPLNLNPNPNSNPSPSPSPILSPT